MFALIAPLFSFLSGIAPAISSFFTTKMNVEATEFSAMTSTEQAEAIALVQAQTALNQSKVLNNSHGAAQLMVYAFGVPVAMHWCAVWIATTFPSLHWTVLAAPKEFQGAEMQIALSFFLLAPALPIVSSLAARLGR